MKKLQIIWILCFASPAIAEAPNPFPPGLAVPLGILWAITHPISAIQALASMPAEKRRTEAIRLAVAQCEAEEKLLPVSIEIDSFIDEGAALDSGLIYELLLKRNVKAIYVRPQLDEKGKFVKFGSSDNPGTGSFKMPAWDSPNPLGTTYIKLELGVNGEANCLLKEMTPLYVRESYSRPPALPSTCLAYSLTNDAQTQHALRYATTEAILDQQFGTWSIVNLATAKSLARLTTIDTPPAIVISPGDGKHCRAPYSILARRIRPAAGEPNRFKVTESISVASPSFLEVTSQSATLPFIQTELVKTPFKQGEWESRVYDIQQRWQAATEEAIRTGIGHFYNGGDGFRSSSSEHRIGAGAHGSGRILDWTNRSLVGLQLVGTGTKLGWVSWEVSASNGGFIAFTNNWVKAREQFVARYDIHGSLNWAVRIPGELGTLGCGFAPQEARETETDIVLVQPSCNHKEGTEYRIPKSKIAFYKVASTRGTRP